MAENRRAGLGSLRDQKVASKGGVVFAQPVLGLNVGDHPSPAEHGFSVEPKLRPDEQIAINQATQANQHNRTVRSDVPQFVCTTCFGRHHPTTRADCIALLQFHFPATTDQHLPNTFSSHFGRFIEFCLGTLSERFQALFPNIFFVGAKIRQNFGRVARHTQ